MSHFLPRILRNKVIRSFWQIFLSLATSPLFLLGYCIPKNPHTWVFANTFGFKDNARYLFEYVQTHHPEITPIWISRDPHCVDTTHCPTRFSFTGMWYQYRAGIAFVSTGHGDLARFTLAKTKIIQLWHGIPIKRILLDSPESLPFNKKRDILRNLSLRLLKKNLQRYNTIIASSQTVQKRLMAAFGLPADRVKITGYPRHDIIFEASHITKRRILYAPTWRSNTDEAFSIISSICNHTFISALTALQYELWVSIHPLNHELITMIPPDVRSSLHLVENHDVNRILAQSEILITDYSSIAIDFSLLNRKIIFYTPDSEDYLQGRGIYKEFEALFTKHSTTNSDELIKAITNTGTYFHFDNTSFCLHKDTGARKRIVDMVKNNCLPET